MGVETVEALLQGKERQPHHLIEVLLDIQESEGFVSEKTMWAISERLSVPPMEVYRVANFYKVISLEPRGKHLITICLGTACHVRTAALLFDEVLFQLGVAPSGTTADGLFTVQRVNCLGACALGPVVLLDAVYYHHMTPAKLRKLIRSTRNKEKEVLAHA
jgi:NADH:ubiquinone oxidoreductase subunit E